jgi:ClpP class serine protease
VTLADYSQYFKLKGIDLKEIYADASTEKNKMHRDAINGDNTELKKFINKFNDAFLELVSTNRTDKLKSESWKTGKIYFANEAKDVGLIDDIASFEEALSMMEPLIN